MGKTRLIHHVLEQEEHAQLHARVRYTKDAEGARVWLEHGGLAQSPDLVLVLDEVPPADANELWRSFLRKARVAGQARLVLLGLQDDADEGRPKPSLLRPFGSEQHRRALVEHDLRQAGVAAGEDTDALMGVVARLAEGYPLFSMWLTRALAKDPTLLDAPGSGLTDGQDPWLATAAVLAGPRSEHRGDRPAQLSLANTARLKQEQEDDRALARELLSEPDVIIANLAWLTSEQAGRSRILAHILGVEDDDNGLLPRLMAVRDEHAVDSLIVGYLVGRSEARGSTALDPWLSEQAEEPSMAKIVARTIVAIGGSDTRARLLCDLVGRGGLDQRALLGLGFWSWHEGVNLAAIDALITVLARAPREFCHTEGLGLMARRLERSQSTIEPTVLELAHSLLRLTSSDDLSAVAERDWIAVAIGLHERGDVAAMRTVLSLVAAQRRYLSHARKVLERWLEDDALALWNVLAGEFAGLEGEQASVLGHVASQLNIMGRVPHQEVMRWVGVDMERALKVADWSSPHEEDLDLVIRGLLTRFGSDGEVAKSLFGAAMLCPSRMSFDTFEQQQLERATRWASDPNPEVAAWAHRLRDILRERAEHRRQRGYG